jgi:hypothetical protein
MAAVPTNVAWSRLSSSEADRFLQRRAAIEWSITLVAIANRTTDVTSLFAARRVFRLVGSQHRVPNFVITQTSQECCGERRR